MVENQAISSVQPALAYGPQSFCVVLKNDGQVERISEKKLEDYLQFVEGASVAWIDYTTTDLEKEIEDISQILGFSQTPIQKLLSGYYSGYEDSDSELGIVLPAVLVTQLDISVRPLVILIHGNFIVTIHSGEVYRLNKFSRYANTFLKKMKH